MVQVGIDKYDDRIGLPRHRENLERLDKILEKVTSVETWKNGWDAVLADRNARGGHRRDWLAPVLAAIIGALVAAMIALMVDHKLASGLHIADTPTSASAEVSASGRSY